MSVRIDENTDHMKYTDDMEAIDSDIMDRVIAEMNSYDADIYTAKDVKEALAAETCSVDNFKALLSPAALPFLEEIAQKAQKETRKHFGNSVAIFTPLYIANYCENYCVYCGFNCHNKIKRAQLNAEEIEKEMQAIAETKAEVHNFCRKGTFGSMELAQILKETYEDQEVEIELIGLCTDICVISNAMLIKAALPEVKVSVDSSCCAGVTPESHRNALEAMKMCQIEIV